MRHNLKGRKLNRTSSHRIALLRNLAMALIINKTIKTTVPKAKELRPFIEKLVTIAKKDTLANRRLLIARLGNKPSLANDLIQITKENFSDRPGGYTRIIKSGYRYGDNAPMAIIQFVGFEPQVEGEEALEPINKASEATKEEKETA